MTHSLYQGGQNRAGRSTVRICSCREKGEATQQAWAPFHHFCYGLHLLTPRTRQSLLKGHNASSSSHSTSNFNRAETLWSQSKYFPELLCAFCFCHFFLSFSFSQVFKSRIFILILSTPQEGGEVFSAKAIIKCSDKLTGLKPDISNRSNHSHQTTKMSSNGIICQHKQKDKYKQTHQSLKPNSHVNLRLWQED